MRKTLSTLLATGLLAAGCAATPVSPNAVTLGVEFQLAPEHRCSNRSPELRVSGLPAGVKELRARLEDLDVTSWDHGGGKVASDGTGVVPAGALKHGYNGPCPPSGSHRYQFTVQAVDGAGVIVGQGKGVRVFP